MKKLTLAFIFMLTVAVCVMFHLSAYGQAQGGRQGQRTPMTIDQRIDQLDKQVTLTPDQKKQIRAIMETGQKTRAQAPPPSSPDRPNSRREQLNQSQQQTQQRGGRGGGFGGFGGLSPEIQKILTPAQLKKFQASLSQTNIDRSIERLSSLNLTDDQKKKLRPIFEKQDQMLTKMREQRQQNQDPQAMMDTFRKMREESDKEIVKVLTPAQSKQYTDMQQQMMNRGQNRGQGGGQGRGQQN